LRKFRSPFGLTEISGGRRLVRRTSFGFPPIASRAGNRQCGNAPLLVLMPGGHFVRYEYRYTGSHS